MCHSNINSSKTQEEALSNRMPSKLNILFIFLYTVYLQSCNEDSCAVLAASDKEMLIKNLHSQSELQWPIRSRNGDKLAHIPKFIMNPVSSFQASVHTITSHINYP